MLIRLTGEAGKDVYINTNQIVWLIPYEVYGFKGSRILFTTGLYVEVRESPDLVKSMIPN
jgi:hypothetical protein